MIVVIGASVLRSRLREADHHQIALGLLLIVAFSLGLAGTLAGLGLVVWSSGCLARIRVAALGRAVPALSRLLIGGVGFRLSLRAVPQLL